MWMALQRTFREVMFLQDLNNHDNIIRSAWGCSAQHVVQWRKPKGDMAIPQLIYPCHAGCSTC